MNISIPNFYNIPLNKRTMEISAIPYPRFVLLFFAFSFPFKLIILPELIDPGHIKIVILFNDYPSRTIISNTDLCGMCNGHIRGKISIKKKCLPDLNYLGPHV
jgi:hypothetical protein